MQNEDKKKLRLKSPSREFKCLDATCLFTFLDTIQQ